jgi:hypothetical protein
MLALRFCALPPAPCQHYKMRLVSFAGS